MEKFYNTENHYQVIQMQIKIVILDWI